MRRAAVVILGIGLLASGCGGGDARPVAPTETATPGEAAGPAGAPIVSLRATSEDTVLSLPDGATRTLPGSFEHARVAPGFAPDGWARQAKLLVLEDPSNRETRTTSRFALVDPTVRTEPRVIELRGDYDYDAISPDGTRLYLANYFSVEDPKGYVVRFYDLARGALDPNPVVDKRGRFGETMSGEPLSRIIGDDGAWVYTLYRGREHPFVHALETTHGNSVCIDLPHTTLAITDWTMALNQSARTLNLTSAATTTTVRVILDEFRVEML